MYPQSNEPDATTTEVTEETVTVDNSTDAGTNAGAGTNNDPQGDPHDATMADE